MVSPEPLTPPPSERQIRGACPLDCPDTCSWIVSIKDGEAVALRGDPAHPYPRGSLCNKVENYLSYTRSFERLLYPMRRTGPKGSGEFTRISWDEALERIAAEFGDAIAKHGAEAIWPYGGSGSMELIQGIYGAGERLGLLHVVLAEGKEDRQFIGDRTVGWEAVRQRILDFPPSRAAVITGLPAESIVQLGRRLAETRPTAIRIGIGLQRHGGGGMAVRTITCIPGVTGDWRHPGGGVFYDTRGFFGVNWAALCRDDLRTHQTRTLDMKRLGEVLLDVDNPPVKVLFVYASNPAASVPNQTEALRGLARNDLFTVVVEHFLTDTARYADIVLPATMQIEHRDLLIAYGHLYLAWNEPAVPPPGECLPATEMFRRLARKMDLDMPAVYDSDEAIARQLLGSGHPPLAGITFEGLKARLAVGCG